jgi:hypothetical protein
LHFQQVKGKSQSITMMQCCRRFAYQIKNGKWHSQIHHQVLVNKNYL